MDTLTSLDEDILYIFDEPAPARAPRRRWRIARLIGLAAAVAALVIVAAVVPAVREYRRKLCDEYLDRIGRAFHEYHRVQGHFPAPALPDRDGKPLLSWRVALLPQLGYQSLYERFHLDEPWDTRVRVSRGTGSSSGPDGIPGGRRAKDRGGEHQHAVRAHARGGYPGDD
jgi:hypothetical protein